MSNITNRRSVALLWAQFSPYHVDRCEAAARVADGRYNILACEIATTSSAYAWEPSGEVVGAQKVTIYPGRSYDSVPWPHKVVRLFKVLRTCDAVFIGVPYNEPEIIVIAWCLRAFGKRVYMMMESKFDDKPRHIGFELLKSIIFLPYNGAISGGRRHTEYLRFLGFNRRPVFEGYDTVGMERVRMLGDCPPAPNGPKFQERSFVFVARFVAKKNIIGLLQAYSRYTLLCDAPPRHLILVGGGELEGEVAAEINRLNIADTVILTGFQQAEGVAKILSKALALVLPSLEEQWGLVVNEAMAFSLPIIVSEAAGSRDTLVENLLNGFVVNPNSIDGIAQAMFSMSSDENQWNRMVNESARRARLGDVERFGHAVAAMLAHSAT